MFEKVVDLWLGDEGSNSRQKSYKNFLGNWTGKFRGKKLNGTDLCPLESNYYK